MNSVVPAGFSPAEARPFPPDDAGITVLVCCYNSAQRLPATLKALAALDPPTAAFGVEVLVLDNASTDETSTVAQQLLAELKPFFGYQVLHESRPGKPHALEQGFAAARYRYICIVDDDNWLAPDYLNLAWSVMEGSAQIGALGGAGQPASNQPLPEWFPRFASYYAAAPQAPDSGDVTRTNSFLYGAGMVVRKSAWREVTANGFVSLLTPVLSTQLASASAGRSPAARAAGKPAVRRGRHLLSGEDVEMCYGLIFGGYQIWYDERLRFQHFIPVERHSWQYLQRTVRVNATSQAMLRPWNHYLEPNPPLPSKVPSFIWLRNAAYTLRGLLVFLGRAIRRGELGQEGSVNALEVYYKWHYFNEYVAKALRRDQSFHVAQACIMRLRAHHPSPMAT